MICSPLCCADRLLEQAKLAVELEPPVKKANGTRTPLSAPTSSLTCTFGLVPLPSIIYVSSLTPATLNCVTPVVPVLKSCVALADIAVEVEVNTTALVA